MTKITCPYCGKAQEPVPGIILCQGCYNDIRHVVEPFFEKSPRTALSASMGMSSSYGPLVKKAEQAEPKSGLKIAGSAALLKKTANICFARFPVIFPFAVLTPLSFVGIFFFIWISNPEVPMERLGLTPVTAVLGLISAVLAFCVSHAGLITAISSDLGVLDSLIKGLERNLSFSLLTAFVAVVIALGFALLIVPGIIAAGFLLFTPFIFATEGVGPTEAVSRSCRYARSAGVRLFLMLWPLPLAAILLSGPIGLAASFALAFRNEFLFAVLWSILFGLPVIFSGVFIFTLYQEVRSAPGAAAPAGSAARDRVTGQTIISAPSLPAAELPQLSVLVRRAVAIFKERWPTLTALNAASITPYAVNISALLMVYFFFPFLIRKLGLQGEMFWLRILTDPAEVLGLIGPFSLVLTLYLIPPIVSFRLHFLIRLAIIYAIGDPKVTALQAVARARQRLKGYSAFRMMRNMTCGTGFAFFSTGGLFSGLFFFTPYIYAFEESEAAPRISISKSLGYGREILRPLKKRLFTINSIPVVLPVLVMLFVVGGFPLFLISASTLFGIFGIEDAGLFHVAYGPIFWGGILLMLALFFALVFGPVQKIVFYLLYKERKNPSSIP